MCCKVLNTHTLPADVKTVKLVEFGVVTRQKDVMQCVAGCCRVLQGVAGCCSVLQLWPCHGALPKGMINICICMYI